MSYIDLDGFDYYTNAQNGITGWSATFNTMQTGRFGVGQAARILNTNTCIKSYASAMITASIGFSIKFVSTLGSGGAFLTTYDGATIQNELRVDVLGRLTFTRNGTVLATSGGTVFVIDVWYDVVYTCTYGNAGAGSFEVFVGGVSIFSDSSLDNTNSSNQSITRVQLGAPITCDFDDFWVQNTINNPGDLRIATLFPSADGYLNQFTRSAGSTNYTLVDEATHNSDTDYVEDGTVGHIDSYAMSNLPTVPNGVKALVVRAVGRKTDAGAKTGRIGVRSGTTNYESSDIALPASYALLSDSIRVVDPNTSAAWTESGVNAIEAFVKVQA